MYKKLCISLIFVFSILVIFNIKSNAAISVEKTSVDIYQIDGYISKAYSVTLPSEYPTTYQIKINGTTEKAKYEVIEGQDIVSVSENGLVEPKYQNVTYVGGSITGTYKKYEYGTAKIKVTVAGSTFNITINVINYVNYYSKNVLQEYINKNITSNMSNLDKLKKICEFVASYDYSANASSYQGMILSGGGDCWASSYCIIEMCNMVGLKSQLRYAAIDPGAGSGHRNVSVLIDGKVYIAEAGYNEKAPRYYSVTEQPYGLYYSTRADGTINIRQYNGFDGNIVIPEEINGKKVTMIDADAFYWGNAYGETEVLSVTLPKTIEKIGEAVFLNCNKLTSLVIPENVEYIGGRAFEGCTNLNNLTINSKNLVVENNVIYDKNKTILMCLMPNKEVKSLVTPSTLKTINPYAFYEHNIENIVLNQGLTEIGRDAFHYSTIRGITIPKTVTSIGEDAFSQCNELGSVIIEDGCTSKLDEYSFYWNPKLYVAKVPSSITNIANKAFKDSYNLTIYGTEGSKAQEYANNNSIKFSTNNAIPISNGMITLNTDKFTYNKTAQKPNVTIYYGSKILKVNQDYTITYSSDVTNAGTKNVTVKGNGSYTGTATAEYEIEKAEREFDFEIKDIIYGQGKLTPVITKNPTNVQVEFFYGEVGSMWSSNSVPTEIGEYEVYVSIPPSDNYKACYVEKTVSILKPEMPFRDIKLSDWYYNSVKYCTDNKIIYGTTDTTFSPNNNLTRANLVTILWRMEGSKKVSGSSKFSDVKSQEYYYDAVNWAASKGIVNGYEDGKFRPNNNITREQLATILMNYAKYKGKDTRERTDLNKFVDNKGISSYAKDSISWAVAKKVMSGKVNGTMVDPSGTAIRAEAAAMITNYCNYVGR